MSRPTVYLAGPITGLDYDGVTEWRIQVARELSSAGIEPYSPMRAKEFTKDVQVFSKMGEPGGQLASAMAINMRDHWDCRTKDLVFVNFLGATEVSIGTVMEIAWAYAYRTPVVLVMEKGGINPHEHAMLLQSGGHFWAETLEQGIAHTKAILLSMP